MTSCGPKVDITRCFLFWSSKIGVGIAFSHEKRENGKFVDEKFLTGKSDEKNGKLSSLKLGIFG